MTTISAKNTMLHTMFLAMAIGFPVTVQAHALVFIHIGATLPPYIYSALFQARTFNKESDIYLLANKEALKNSRLSTLEQYHILPIYLESLPRTHEHNYFLQHTVLPYTFREGFWVYTSERFLYLYDFAELYKIEDLIHLETDMMVYTDFSKIMPILREHYSGIGITLDADDRCIPGIVFFRDILAVRQLAKCFSDKAYLGKNDMEILSHFYHENASSRTVEMLPIIMPDYHTIIGLGSTKGKKTQHPEKYSQHSDQFFGIFDGAALGQYLGGIDPRNGSSVPGFVNETCLFNPSLLVFSWGLDDEQRKVPFVMFNGKQYKIFNLHIHSKNLALFTSVVMV